ncbi:hypothetical protein [Segniliparus rugosus]|uniref:Lipoprotein n=1 Tax=Segniliparus rugosus (strain ATCC BAA-974 / DSM 45345 / CCUG 50838 / CIP 108380 / JCM 13579 / CDC 945) TaxID=679197 RepID=E5XQE5_SEGRC|nr:hypothetical protein [Segniliparus rugosus]EFV13428.1 hypothetical protein HMPREF9336_01717 [Segniliparus rugosus ATCC BAA-974]
MATEQRRARRTAALLGACAVLTAGCDIGAVDRHDFNRLAEERGGGLVSALPQEGISALRAALGVSDFDVVGVLLSASGQRADFRVRQPGRPDREDSYSYAQGRLSAPRPVRVSAQSAASASVFPISQLTAFDRVEEIVDTALAKTGFEDGRVTSISADLVGGAIQVAASVDSPRAATTVLFDKGGSFVEVKPW